MAVILLQLLLGRIVYTEQGLLAILYLLWAGALILLGSALRGVLGAEAIARTLAWWLLCGGVAAALWSLLLHYEVAIPLGPYTVNFHTRELTVRGAIGQPNHFADYLALALASLAYLFADRRLGAVPAILAAGIVLLAMALTGSRATWLYCVALPLLALGLRWRRPGAPASRLVLCAALIFAGFAAMHWVATLPFLPPERAVVAVDRVFDLAPGTSWRLQLWREAWSAFLAAPLLGAGLGQFGWIHFQSAAQVGPNGIGLCHQAHNFVMQLLAETGISGALIVAAGAGVWIAGLKRLALDLHAWWLFAVLAIIAIHSQFEYPLWYANFLGIAALLLGVGAGQFVASGARALRPSSIALALVTGWFVALTTLASYRDFDLLLNAADTAGAPAKRDFAAELLKIRSESLLTPQVELAIALAITPDAASLREKLELNTRILHFWPAARVAYQQATLLLLNGERAAALAQMRDAANAYPRELEGFAQELAALDAASREIFAPLREFAAARLRSRATP